MLIIETIDGLTTISPHDRPQDVWAFQDGDEALLFIQAWYADDIRAMVRYDARTRRTFYDYGWSQ